MTQGRRFLKILVLLFGATLLAVGVGCAILYLVLPFVYRGDDLVATNLTIASTAALTLGLGFALTYHARNSLRGRNSEVFRPPSPWLVVLAFAPCLLLGQAILSFLASPRLTSLAFPPLHVLAAVGPALAILAFVGRRTMAGSWRTVSLEVCHGAFLAPMGALAVELAVLLAVVLLLSVIVALTPGGAGRLMELSLNLQDPAWLGDPTNLAELVLSPGVLAAIIVIFVLVAPLVEEFLKGLGVLLLWHRMRGGSEALLWGVSCGAGFALAESLFNGTIALEGWWAVMLVRWGATLMHCLGSGLMGLGWHAALVSKRPARWVGAYGASAGIHALWNGAALGVAFLSLLMLTRPDDLWTQGLAGLAALGLLTFLFLLIISMALVMLYLTRRATGAMPEAVALDQGDSLAGGVL